MVDYLAMESLRFLGVEGADCNAPVKFALYSRDLTQVCRYLKDYPPTRCEFTAPTWQLDLGGSSTPAALRTLFKPDRWVSLDFDPAWLDRSPWESGDWDFPTFAEVQAASALG